MSKKSFSSGLDSLLGDNIKEKEQKKPVKEVFKTSQIGTLETETRATFIVNEELLEKIKAIAYWDRLLIKEIINKSFSDTIEIYEKNNGKIKPIPTK